MPSICCELTTPNLEALEALTAVRQTACDSAVRDFHEAQLRALDGVRSTLEAIHTGAITIPPESIQNYKAFLHSLNDFLKNQTESGAAGCESWDPLDAGKLETISANLKALVLRELKNIQLLSRPQPSKDSVPMSDEDASRLFTTLTPLKV